MQSRIRSSSVVRINLSVRLWRLSIFARWMTNELYRHTLRRRRAVGRVKVFAKVKPEQWRHADLRKTTSNREPLRNVISRFVEDRSRDAIFYNERLDRVYVFAEPYVILLCACYVWCSFVVIAFCICFVCVYLCFK